MKAPQKPNSGKIKMVEGLEAKFNEYLQKWREHCINSVNSSNPNDYINCDVYRKIVSMGTPILPLIRKLYDKKICDFVSDMPGHIKISKYDLFTGSDINQLSKIVGKLRDKEFSLEILKGHVVGVVKEIIGNDFQIPEEIRGRIDVMEEYTKKWLDENMYKYIQK